MGEWIKGKAEGYRDWLYACYEEQGITVVRTPDFIDYMRGVYADLHDPDRPLWTKFPAFFDTSYDGTLLHGTPLANKLFYIEPFNRFTLGWELNYVGIGMSSDYFHIPLFTTYELDFGWKTANAIYDGWGGEYRLGDAANKNMYFFTTLGKAAHDVMSSK